MARKTVQKVKEFDVVFERDESGYVVALVPELPGCHTQGKTLSEAAKRVKEAIELYLEVSLSKLGAKSAAKSKFLGIRRIAVPLPA